MISKKTIAIVDYGLGNLYSISKAAQRFAKEVVITDSPNVISSADGVIIPGVGAFAAGMRGLEERELVKILQDLAVANKPMLGICLGAQLMLKYGFEFGKYQGLNIIPGVVKLFPTSVAAVEKIPHIGWNGVSPPIKELWNDTIFTGINNQANVYFVIVYIMIGNDPADVVALAEYGGLKFCAAIKNGKVYGVQFHPEKSGEVGLSIIKNFINIC